MSRFARRRSPARRPGRFVPRASAPRRAFTLSELLMALALAAMLLGGMASAIVVASHALPGRTAPGDALTEGAGTLTVLAHDLHCATGVSERTASAITVTVPDRTGDALAETIRYAWSGVAGDPLTREVNGGGARTLLTDVQEFSLQYDITARESLLFSYVSGSSTSDANIVAGSVLSQYFRPTLSGTALSWSVMRVNLMARGVWPYDSQLIAQIRPPSGLSRTPDSTVLEQVSIAESGLSGTYSPLYIRFSSVTGLTPGQGACLVLSSGDGTLAARVQYYSTAPPSSDRLLSQSLTGGAPWASLPNDATLVIRVYGAIADTDLNNSSYRLAGVRITLRQGSDTSARVQTGMHLLNMPKVSGP